jgi:type I site-specific restriction endonuclease
LLDWEDALLDRKTVEMIEAQMTESINGLRTATQKRFDKLMKRSKDADTKMKRAKYFNQAIAILKQSEHVIEELETKMAAIKNPWHAKAPAKKSKRKRT